MGFWKGNLPQVLRVVPYSAAQLYSYECYKSFFADKETGELSVYRRLAAGACAGMTATILTHPLDTLRLRIAVDPKCKTLLGAVAILAKEGGLPAFYRGLGASMAGIAPYMALELSTYDILPQNMPSFARGFTAALIATVSCYPVGCRRGGHRAGGGRRWAVSRIFAQRGQKFTQQGHQADGLQRGKGGLRKGPGRAAEAAGRGGESQQEQEQEQEQKGW